MGKSAWVPLGSRRPFGPVWWDEHLPLKCNADGGDRIAVRHVRAPSREIAFARIEAGILALTELGTSGRFRQLEIMQCMQFLAGLCDNWRKLEGLRYVDYMVSAE